tara:strand:- start:458 stop:745 length:288 start_codon:yes stop_codon:yes gene_type:complete
MALTKTTADDRIEVVGDYKHIQIRTATIIKDDGVEISRSFQRKTIDPGTLDSSNNLISRDVSAESTDVKNIAAAVWTDSVKETWRQHLVASSSSG